VTTKSESRGSPNSPYYYTRYSDGVNGRTEIGPNGKPQAKWNSYEKVVKEQYIQPFIDNTYTTLHNGPDPRLLWDPSEDLTLQSKFANKVRGHDFNLAVFIAEGQQAIDTTTDVLKTLIEVVRQTKKGNYLGAGRAFLDYNSRNVATTARKKAKGVSGRVLQEQYGIRPLLNDVYDAWKAYEALTQERKDRVSQTRKIERDWFHGNVHVSPPSAKCTLQKKITIEMKEHLSLARGLGLYDPASVIWEKMPWSFVADWFIPIGTYLDNLSVIPFLKGRFLTSFSSEVIFVGTGSGSVWWDVGGSMRIHIYTYKRTPSTHLEVSSPRFKDLRKALSTEHLFNAMALFTQVASGGNPSRGQKS
jgi:hypothetical protein